MRNTPRRAGAVALAVGALLLSACQSATEGGGGGSSAADSDDPCVQEAQKVVDDARADLPLAVPEAELDAASVAGSNIWVISILSNQWTQGVTVGLENAAEDLDVDLTVYDGQGSVDRWNTGIQQAIASKADAIALLAVDPKIVSQSVAEAEAAGIPVTNAFSAKIGDPVLPGIFSNLQADNHADGYATGAWMIADSGCTAHALMMYGSGVPLWEAQMEGITEAFDELCPDDCELTTTAVDLANMATDMPRQTQTALTEDPDLGYVYPAQDSAVPFVEPAVMQVRPDVKVVSRDGVAENLDALREGGAQRVDVVMPPDEWMGYAILDEAARAVAGAEPNGLEVPTRLVDETNVGDSNEDIFPEYVDFEDAFRSVWGVG